MRYRDIVEAVEPTEYGYWVLPDGQIVPVQNQEHYEVARKIGNMSQTMALESGWVRIIAYCNWLAVDFRRSLTLKAARAVKKIARTFPANDYTIDSDGPRERFETTKRIAFLTAIDQHTAE